MALLIYLLICPRMLSITTITQSLYVNRSHWRQLIYTTWECKLKIIRNWHSAQSAYEIIYGKTLTHTHTHTATMIQSYDFFPDASWALTRLSNSIQASVNWADIQCDCGTELWSARKSWLIVKIAATINNRRPIHTMWFGKERAIHGKWARCRYVLFVGQLCRTVVNFPCFELGATNSNSQFIFIYEYSIFSVWILLLYRLNHR